MRNALQVVGVGHSCLDTICSIENYPKEDESTHIVSISKQGGGAVATALVALSRLGIRSGFIGTVSTSLVSQEILDLFRKDGVCTDFIDQRADVAPLESIVMVNRQNGSRTKFPQRDLTPALIWSEKKTEAVKSAQVLHLDGTHYENAVHAATIAKEAGVLVSLDGCQMQAENEKNRRLAKMADILIMNKRYPLRITGKDDYREALLEIASWGAKFVICTLGEKGCMAVIDGCVRSFPSYPVGVVDTTGAGDTFHGAFIAGYLEGMDYEKAIRYASVVAALKCRKPGGRDGIPSREEALMQLENWHQ